MNPAIRLLILGFLTATLPTHACLNEYGANDSRIRALQKPRNVFESYASDFDFDPPEIISILNYSPPAPKPVSARSGQAIIDIVNNPPKADWAARERSLRARATASNASYKDRSDYAAILLHLGRTREAIDILEP